MKLLTLLLISLFLSGNLMAAQTNNSKVHPEVCENNAQNDRFTDTNPKPKKKNTKENSTGGR